MLRLKKVLSGLSFMKSENNRYKIPRLVKKYYWINSLRYGYPEMGEINLDIAQMCLEADNECFRQCEEKLTECE